MHAHVRIYTFLQITDTCIHSPRSCTYIVARMQCRAWIYHCPRAFTGIRCKWIVALSTTNYYTFSQSSRMWLSQPRSDRNFSDTSRRVIITGCAVVSLKMLTCSGEVPLYLSASVGMLACITAALFHRFSSHSVVRYNLSPHTYTTNIVVRLSDQQPRIEISDKD